MNFRLKQVVTIVKRQLRKWIDGKYARWKLSHISTFFYYRKVVDVSLLYI